MLIMMMKIRKVLFQDIFIMFIINRQFEVIDMDIHNKKS